MTPTRVHVRAAAVAAGVTAADLGSKSLAASRATPPLTNEGLLLGFAYPTTSLLIALAVAGIVGFGALLVHHTRSGILPFWVAGLLMGGAAGNLIDRVTIGGVRDFISTPWIVFNVGDVAILVGVISYLAYVRSSPAEERSK